MGEDGGDFIASKMAVVLSLLAAAASAVSNSDSCSPLSDAAAEPMLAAFVPSVSGLFDCMQHPPRSPTAASPTPPLSQTPRENEENRVDRGGCELLTLVRNTDIPPKSKRDTRRGDRGSRRRCLINRRDRVVAFAIAAPVRRTARHTRRGHERTAGSS